MREKLYTMMQILVEKCLQERNILHDEREISALLSSRGFPQEEIYDATSWLQQSHGEGSEGLRPGRRAKAIRVMHPEERLAFTPAALGLLHRLHIQGAIDDYLREEIIQRCIDVVDEEIGLAEMKSIALLVLFKKHRDAPAEHVLKLIEEDFERPTD